MIFIKPPECLINFILLKNGCYSQNGQPIQTPEAKSGYYIESLQGISIENLSDISDENYNATSLVNNMVYMASEIVQKRLTGYLSNSGYDLNKRGGKYEACSFTTKYDLPAPLDKGIRISKANVDSLQALIKIDSIKLKSSTTGSGIIKVTDENFNILFSSSITVQGGEISTFKVDKSFSQDIIYLLVDSTNLSLYQLDCTSKGGCCGQAIQYNHPLKVMGFDGVQNSMIGYLGACLRLNCTDKDIICQFLDRLKMPILYQTGVEILKEWLSPSSRMNYIKCSGEDWAKETIQEWESKSIEFLEAEIANIQKILSYDKYCYSCENNIRTINTIP